MKFYELDTLAVDAPDAERYADGKILEVRRLVLDAKKLQEAPALFRVRDQCHTYVVSQVLADEFVKRRFTNMELIELACV